jgi:butyryl-CoA dehydrogenase
MIEPVEFRHTALKGDKKAERIIHLAREFRRKYIDPVADEIDRKMLLEPHYHPDEIVRKGCDYGFLTFPVPSFAGGGDGNILHVALLMEELSAGCAGIANIFGAHYLGLSGILMSFDLGIYDRFISELVEEEKRGNPVLFSAAVTEPMAGTDVEEAEYLPKARLITHAKKVDGGYILNGRKVFISNGSVARYNLVICAVDKTRPLETWSGFVVPNNAKGFSIGRVELKMGQRACHAAELVFEDCFVPLANRVGAEGKGMEMTEVILAASRPPVGAIATGIARGAYERLIDYCRKKGIIDKQWVQFGLADIHSAILTARNLYIESARIFNEMLYARLTRGRKFSEPFLGAIYKMLRTGVGKKITMSERFKNATSKFVESRLNKRNTSLSLGLSSMAKFSCSDIAVRVCLKAMEIAGAGSIEERTGIEKYLRDAKLTQIYEGTNQLNRYEVYKNLIKEPPQ